MFWLDVDYHTVEHVSLNTAIANTGLKDVGRLNEHVLKGLYYPTKLWQDDKGKYYQYKGLATNHKNKTCSVLLKLRKLSANQI